MTKFWRIKVNLLIIPILFLSSTCFAQEDLDEMIENDNDSQWHQTLGEQRVAVILAHEPGENTLGKTPEEVWHEIFDMDYEHSYNNFLFEQSYGKTWLSGQVYGWYEVNSTNVFQNIIQAADSDIDYSKIDAVIFVTPTDRSLTGFCVLSYVGHINTYDTQEGAQSLVKMFYGFEAECLIEEGLELDFSRKNVNEGRPVVNLEGPNYHDIFSHEMGHVLLQAHANVMLCGDDVYSVDGSGCRFERIVGSADRIDQLGIGPGHHNALLKENMKWFNQSNILEITESGTYTIRPLEITTNEVQLLKVPRVECEFTEDENDPCWGDGRGWYYVEYRRPIGHDRGLFLSSLNHDGAAIRVDGFYPFQRTGNYLIEVGSYLLDMDPADSNRYTLEKDMSFEDPHRGTTITTLEVNDDSLVVEVNLVNGACGDGITQEQFEECDDGNQNTNDACTNFCKTAKCGDKICATGTDEIHCPGDCATKVFVTPQSIKGNFGGLERADRICKYLGSFINLDSHWKAWLSDSTTNAADRIHHNSVPYRLVDGTIVAQNWDDLMSCEEGSCLQQSINLTHKGIVVENSNLVWTATDSNGFFAGSSCDDWTNSSEEAITGLTTGTNSLWTESDSPTSCDNRARLFCFEQPPEQEEISQFIRGDANVDRVIDISDPIYSLFALFVGDRVHTCEDAADSNDDGKIDISDAIYTLTYLFINQDTQPPLPFPELGLDPTPDTLGCGEVIVER